jgi:hypothetical protein
VEESKGPEPKEPKQPELFRKWWIIKIPVTTKSKAKLLEDYQRMFKQYQKYQDYLKRVESYKQQVSEIVHSIIQEICLSM